MNVPSLRPTPTALLNPCADPIFKILFTNESKEANQALTDFLTDIIGKKVTDVVLQPNELSGESVTDKQSEFDINCKIQGKIVNIEMQGLNQDAHFGKRVEYHVAHLLNHYVVKGMDWSETPQVFQISVLNFIFDKKEKECFNHYFMRNKNGNTISEILNIIFLELPKVEPLSDDISLLTPAQMWGKFFLYAANSDKKDFIKQLAENNRGISMAVTVLKNISQDEANWYRESRYWMHISDQKSMISSAVDKGHAQGLKEGREQGIKEGIGKGIAQANKKHAINLLEMNVLTIAQIAKSSELSEEEVLKIAEEIKN